MRYSIKNFLIRISGNAQFQRLLERNVAYSLYLMGIGSGTFPYSSGEKALVDRLKQHVVVDKQPLCVFDVGANEGQFLKLIMESGLTHTGGGTPFHVHCFEPGHYAYSLLCAFAEKHPDWQKHCTLNNFGLGRQSGDFDLFYPEAGSGWASLTKRETGHLGIDFKYSERVRIYTLDSYCSRNAISWIDLLKLDVEGHELDILQGGSQMFASRNIRMASFEFGECHIDTRTYFRDLYSFFKDNGMSRMYRITPSGYLMPIDQYRFIYEQFLATNFLALRDEL